MKMRHLFVLAVVAASLLAFAACGDGEKEGTNYPSAGEDRFDNTKATIQIEITPEGVSAAGVKLQALETVDLEGPALVTRSDPEIADDGRAFVETEIVSMELTGTSPALGPIVVRQNPDQQSIGEVRQQEPGEDFPADSFFDVFVEIELPNSGITAENQTPLRIEATLTDLPPAEGDEYRTADGTPVPIHTTDTGRQIGRIVDALHIPEPPPLPTEEPEATETEEAAQPTDTPEAPAAQPQTSGGCEHGETKSILFVHFTELTPGQTLKGTVTGPEGGVIGDGAFTVTADDKGNASVDVDIQLYGTYNWTADGLSGSFEVEAECPD